MYKLMHAGRGACSIHLKTRVESAYVRVISPQRIPGLMALQGDVRPSPMAHPAERPLPKLPLPVRPETRTTPQFDYLFGQNVTEHNPAPSPSGHPLLSGPPT